MTEPILLKPTEAARALGIGRSKLYELMQEGVLESVHIGACRASPPTRSSPSSPHSSEASDHSRALTGRGSAEASEASDVRRPGER